MLMLNIFIGLIQGHFREEIGKINEHQNQSEGLIPVVTRICSEQWIRVNKDKKEQMLKDRNLFEMPKANNPQEKTPADRKKEAEFLTK
jgi:hypothetical protein